ncbi:hypothetical protein [Gracilibacillus salinarum]|uniref:Uncharacterized protein n=1 Tax=Gracilibacillus salinarum TaxID=2932255 RepID=A0ABY4GNY5_9BACI|nr:hypothetical protein [Gracilibacillus salinarum]UOQ85700.1 hypothetical protein MUN87_01985 [Gracilibacillus salinarum]
MIVQILGIDSRYQEGSLESVRVRFKMTAEDGNININGYIPLTAAQYQGNEAFTQLEGIVKQEVANQITGEPNAE